jgi:NAD kinase
MLKVEKLSALNEVTVRRMGAKNMAHLNIYLDGHLLYSTRVPCRIIPIFED